MTAADIRTLYTDSDATGLAAHVRAGDVSAAELVETAVAVIDDMDPALNAVIHRTYDMAREAAAQVDAGDRSGAFAGVPFLLKELASSWTGAPMTNASRYLQGVVASEDSALSARLREAGLVLLGKSNAPENGWSISTEPVVYGPTVNPWDASVTAGGSSGGSAAAVAARMIPIAEASDGAGSIRIPASCCGLVGLKPSRGRVSLAPHADFWAGGAYFLCVSRTVRDTAAYLDVAAGGLPGEPYTPPIPSDAYTQLIDQPPRRMRVGVVTDAPHGVDAEVAQAVTDAGLALQGQGHEVETLALTLDFDGIWRDYTAMTCVETAAMFAGLAELVGRPVTRDDVEPITWAIIERGRAMSGLDHAASIDAVRRAGIAIAGALAPYDVVLTPTLTQPPRPVGHYDMSMTDLDAYNALWTDAACAFPFNVSGLPAMSLPLGWSASGLPMGVQLVGRYGREEDILQTAALFEQAMPWAHRRPRICA